MEAKFSQRLKDILVLSKDEAIRLKTSYISPEILFLGMLTEGEGSAINWLSSNGIDLKEMRKVVELSIKPETSVNHVDYDNFPLLKSAEKILRFVHLEARGQKSEEVNTVHLLLALLREGQNEVCNYLKMQNIDYSYVNNSVSQRGFTDEYSDVQNARAASGQDDDDDDRRNVPPGQNKPSPKNTDTPVLDTFGIDLTRAAEEGKLDPIVGRDIEIERIVQILSRRKKNNPILIGEPGVGKSAIAEGLALRIIEKKVSRVLFGKRIVTLDLASIVAGTKYRGQFEERIKSLLNELSKTNDVILFIDEIHTIVGAGGASGSLDAANMLKPALARGDLQCIGSTTLDEYRQYIEKDGALERRFQKVLVNPTTQDETIQILYNIKDRYEEHHNVKYTDAALKACVYLSERYITDRHLPDKAIDVLDESGSNVHISNISVPKRVDDIEKQIELIRLEKIGAVKSQNFEIAASYRDNEQVLLRKLQDEKNRWERELQEHRETVDESHVERVVAMMTGIPVQRVAQAEGARLLKMKDQLKQHIIGQDEAIQKIVKAIQRNRAGLKDPNKPIGSFIFLGPTGVGKTQLAKIIAEFLFDSADSLIRIDMSEYMEKFSVSRLVGAPPGYIGYEEGGQLTEQVRRRPYSVVLLDEIEKAHPDVFHLLLQMLDEGRLTDSLGRKIDFKNTIIIMTSNIGSREIQDFGRGVGFSTQDTNDEQNNTIIQKALKKAFAPEFLNRIDDVVLFNSLRREHVHKIIDIELKGLYERIAKIGYKLEITAEAKDFITDKGFDAKFGARPLKRAIQKYLEDEMAEVIIEASISEGDVIKVGMNEKNDGVRIEILKISKEEDVTNFSNEIENQDDSLRN